VIENKNIIQQEDKAVLVGLVYKEQTEPILMEYLAELAFLAETAGATTEKIFFQKLQRPDSKTFVGKGKLEEIKTYVQAKGIQLVIFDDELTGSQIGNISEVLGVKVIDRSDLILDIFVLICPCLSSFGEPSRLYSTCLQSNFELRPPKGLSCGRGTYSHSTVGLCGRPVLSRLYINPHLRDKSSSTSGE